MKQRDVLELIFLGALWGASFLFTRIAAPEFGPMALIEVRIVIAAIMLTAIVYARGEWVELRGRALSFLVLGAVNSAIPFCLFAYAALTLSAGFSSVLNATSPLFTALVASIWLRESPTRIRLLALVVGFSGVVLLVSGKFSLRADQLAIAAGLTAALLYGVAAIYTKKYFTATKPMAVAAGSQIAASLLLLPGAYWYWPDSNPSPRSWLCAIALGVGCTGLAYALYFRLLQRIGVVKSVSVAYLIPVFGMIWGYVFLGEPVTLTMLIGCAVILLGVTTLARSGVKIVPSNAEIAEPNSAAIPKS